MKTQRNSTAVWPAEGGAILRWVPERNEGQECILRKGQACLAAAQTDGCIELYARLSRVAILCPRGSFQRVPRFPACHASYFACLARKNSEILRSTRIRLNVLLSPRERPSKTKFSNRRRIDVESQSVHSEVYKYIFGQECISHSPDQI